jgi:osmoprotectant transport system ATP-binding protein
MIKLDRVVKEFTPGKPVVDQVSFDVGEGETLVLLGTSGSGKTTTLRMINRLLDLSSGHIFIGGQDIRDIAPETLRRGMGYVLQQSGLFPHYTVAENVAVVPRLLHWEARRIAERTAALLEKLHLPPGQYLNAYPAQLSGGQAQRVGLARALAADQPILLMDEPFGALDPITRAHVRKDFRGLDEVRRKTVVMVTHDVTEAFELGDRICLMNDGKVAQWGTPADLLLHPASDFVRAFFDGDRVFLELSVIALRDVWIQLSSVSPGAHGAELPATASLRQGLETALGAKDGRVCVDNGGRKKWIDGGRIMDAYHAYKTGKHG